jgi:hypothetical protein
LLLMELSISLLLAVFLSTADFMLKVPALGVSLINFLA